ncbi:unnamed protein product [Acanthoscelides obtectus]|uniref:Tc1-like transposase DDE domain-containing protein n=1 Tax=Acanthoscelides obtectus TaxID=200917 RepID=A0A9P0LB82_ACAOB|nr:unnamed protein product [Acanthoscelides obtectus]CAK1637589.1 Transposable element Tc3 transposase [Acanthoscelides obtectus]
MLRKDLRLHAYKIQLVQELKDNDAIQRLNFANEMLNRFSSLNNVLFSDEAHFHLNGHVNKQNCRYWSPENPRRKHQKPLHSPKVTVWAAMSAHWCRQRSLWDQEWNSIVFSDESRFCLGMHDGRARVRRRRGERRNPQFFVERRVHHTVGVMVWGAIGYGSRSPLIYIRGNMNAQRYIHEVLEPHLLHYLDTLADPTFQHDNARPHVARVTIDFFQHNDVTLLPWPPRSPDLSPIEHVWDMMGRRLLNLQRPPQTLEALREELVVAWNEIPQEDINHLIRSMPRRVGECVAHQGASTHY